MIRDNVALIGRGKLFEIALRKIQEEFRKISERHLKPPKFMVETASRKTSVVRRLRVNIQNIADDFIPAEINFRAAIALTDTAIDKPLN